MINDAKVFKPKNDTETEGGTVVDLEASILNNQKKIDQSVAEMPKEYGGRPKDKGKEPTRYGDWELKGRCIDF